MSTNWDGTEITYEERVSDIETRCGLAGPGVKTVDKNGARHVYDENSLDIEREDIVWLLSEIAAARALAVEKQKTLTSIFAEIQSVYSKAKELEAKDEITLQAESRGMTTAIGKVWRASGQPGTPSRDKCGYVYGEQWVNQQGKYDNDFQICNLEEFHEGEHRNESEITGLIE